MSQFSTNNLLYLRNGWRQMGIYSEAFYKHWILFPTVTFTAIVPGAYPGESKMCKKCAKNGQLSGSITGKRLKIGGYMLRYVWQALNSLSVHVKFIAIVLGAYQGEAKMCLRLSWRSQMLAPARCIPAWLSWGSQIICLRLIAETDARSVGDSHPSCNKFW